jgi:FlaA1/EpsC-like NDP-sugar epimerase
MPQTKPVDESAVLARPSRLAQMESFAHRYRLSVSVAVHTFLFSVALLLAYLVRFDATEHKTGEYFAQLRDSYPQWLPIFVIGKLLLFGRMRLLQGGWRYASIRDVIRIITACWIFVAIAFVCLEALGRMPERLGKQPIPYIGTFLAGYSQGVLLLDFLATVFLVCAARLGYRIYREELRPVSPEGVRRVLIVGAGDAAENVVREIFRMRVERYRVVGLVDDDSAKQGLLIHGIPVLGRTQDIPQVCKDEEVEEIIIAMPAATHRQLRRVVDLCACTKLKLQSLPSMGDLIDGRVTVSQIRPVEINDLLGREAIELDAAAVGRFLRDRRVLVTGAGGSIGSEMCRQIAAYQPAQLILVEQAETPLFDIDNELRAAHKGRSVVACVADIYDRQRIFALWDLHKPEVVIHAAAHKHVPMMERNPSEAIKNNILGTRNVADACCRYGSSEFVLISTDKAVRPSSVMGASKRVAEIYTQSLNGRPGCRTQFKAVRFGNVLGSAGSVIPTFRRQIAAGGPVTVTHPEMTRYFMTIPEAAQLVLQAAATGTGGQIYLLDMGDPVKIVDLARQMITLSGFRPGEDIEIVFTGVRPGEKLFEELRTTGEDVDHTVHPKVHVWRTTALEWAKVENAIGELASLENSLDRQSIVKAIQRLVPEYTPLNPPVSGPEPSGAASPLSAGVQASAAPAQAPV